jgi:hypothetical protein
MKMGVVWQKGAWSPQNFRRCCNRTPFLNSWIRPCTSYKHWYLIVFATLWEDAKYIVVIEFNRVVWGGVLIINDSLGGSSGCGVCPWSCSGKVGAYGRKHCIYIGHAYQPCPLMHTI